MLNEIVAYGADAPAELAKYGYSTYRAFLVSGLLHELLHFYTTAAWSGRYKSTLYPAPDCPRSDRRLIGEALNLYFSEQFALELLGAPAEAFAEKIQPGGVFGSLAPLADLDQALHVRGTSLRALFAALLERKRKDRTGYLSTGCSPCCALTLGSSGRINWCEAAESSPDLSATGFLKPCVQNLCSFTLSRYFPESILKVCPETIYLPISYRCPTQKN
ncbi:MAG: hypothetical protein IPK17_36750 [Chloroflexi bacterium]|uniref:hypothetical protein n=1 Tax=Candidatus Flexifilum breve TaxID=3140694 RepID=UPI003135B402|nr:hypothetical protein [Chloroflexota bacterium]